MTREVQVNVWCDACIAEGRRSEAREVTLTIAGAKPRTLDVCAEHEASLIAPLVALLSEYGHAPDGSEPDAPPKTAQADCPVCGHKVSAAHLPKHIYTLHLQVKPPTHRRCPECGWKPPAGTDRAMVPRRVGVHRVHEHGRKTLDDALEALEASRESQAAL